MNPFKKLLSALMIMLSLLWIAPANGMAYCALRDPVKNIYTLFPEATSYRSIVHKIDKSIQKQVKNIINFSIHQDELGQHTLYIAMRNNKPLGLIHSRSEVGLWGLIEVVWAFDFNLNIIDFKFQRCRESSCKLIEDPRFRQLLKEKSSTELSILIKQDDFPFPTSISNNNEAKILAKTIIRSAIKTALVTSLSWHEELQALKKPTAK